jgi:hypothetical protein
MGFMRKALSIASFGLSGLVFKDNSQDKSPAKVAEKQVRPQKQTKVIRSKPQAARRRKPQAARTAAQTAGSGKRTAKELERLADLHGRGELTDAEFAAGKAQILGTSLTSRASGTDPATFPAVEANVAAARHLADLAVHDNRASVAPSVAIDGGSAAGE